MKKTVIILSVFALIAGSCGQTAKKQTETANICREEMTYICKKDTLVSLSETHGILFLKYNKELELWYEPRIVNFRNNDTVIIQKFTYENGSELDIKVSPNKKFAVIDNIIKGYVEMPTGRELHENYTCVLIDIDNAILLDSWVLGCGGEWDKDNKWICGDVVIFPPPPPIMTPFTFEEDHPDGDVTLIIYRNITLAEAYPKFLNGKVTAVEKHLLKEISCDTTYTSNVDNEQVKITYICDYDSDGLTIELYNLSSNLTTLNFEYGNDDICIHIKHASR